MGMIAISQQKLKLDTNPLLTLLQFLPLPPVPCPTSQIEMTAGIDSGIFLVMIYWWNLSNGWETYISKHKNFYK